MFNSPYRQNQAKGIEVNVIGKLMLNEWIMLHINLNPFLDQNLFQKIQVFD